MSLKILHTADWHLGRSLHGYNLVQDQAVVLDQIVEWTEELRPDVVIVAGDLFDRAVPAPDAIELLDDTFCRLVLGSKTRVIAISGNHDSPKRVGFASRLMEERGLHLVTEPLPSLIRIGDWECVATPYSEPSLVRHATGEEAICDHASMLSAQLATLPEALGPRVFIGHLFLVGGGESQSERPLSMGGAEQVPSDLLEPFSYAALGHLHAPQAFGGGRFRYSGSILKYSTSEATHKKSASFVELHADGSLTVECLDFSPRHDLRVIEGDLETLLEKDRSEDYILARLSDPRAVLDADSRLRVRFPNLLGVERPFYTPGRLAAADAGRVRDERGIKALFADFFEAMTGEQPKKAELDSFSHIHDEFIQISREADN